ncbi:TIGR03643 family protein [Pseudomonas sp.]|jgi:uncharacterized protein (TIGR03643 family)|uniref:TIGR03643 family protein n=1 Tax=Pseudomonas sp. TaxID=306 RepID=UPI0037C6D1E1
MQLTEHEWSRVIEMAWEDRTPFEAIESQFGLSEAQVIALMRRSLKAGSFKLWRARVSGRQTKHLQLRDPNVSRGYCPTQYKQR